MDKTADGRILCERIKDEWLKEMVRVADPVKGKKAKEKFAQQWIDKVQTKDMQLKAFPATYERKGDSLWILDMTKASYIRWVALKPEAKTGKYAICTIVQKINFLPDGVYMEQSPGPITYDYSKPPAHLWYKG